MTDALADNKTVAGASHVLPVRRSVSDRSGLVTGTALHYMLVLFTGNVYHVTTDPAGDHGVVGERQLVRPDR